MDRVLTSLDLFSGAGGLSEGLRQAGFKTLFASEINSVYANTFKNNHSESIVSVQDIRTLNPESIRRELGLEAGELDLLAGGPPCQGFSINAPIRSIDDHRNHLFLSFIDFVKEFSPRAVLIENVPGIVSFNGGQVVNDILKTLSSIGYHTDVRILYAAHYGIPQMRWRTFFIGLKDFNPTNCYPHPRFSPPCRANFTTKIGGRCLVYDQDIESDSFISVFDAIDDLPSISNGAGSDESLYEKPPHSDYSFSMRQGSEVLYNHKCARISRINEQRLSFIKQGGSWRDIPHELLPEGLKRARRSDHTKRYGRLDPNGLASTILTKCDPHWGAFFHYDQDRIISVREAARIQSFPDSYRFYGSTTEQYQQVGNAVPPMLSREIAINIFEVLNNRGVISKWRKKPHTQLNLLTQ